VPQPPEPKRSLKDHWGRFRRWFGEQARIKQVALVAVVGLFVALVVGVWVSASQESTSEKFIKEHRAEWIDECGDYATSWVDGTVYVIGGHEWYRQLNRCLQEKANDQTP